MERTVSYKDANFLQRGDKVIFPDDRIREVAGTTKSEGRIWVTYVGGFSGVVPPNFRVKILGGSKKSEFPSYVKDSL